MGTLVALMAGARLAGVARFEDGVASEAALVEARVEGFREPFRAHSDPDGAWELLDVPPGEFTLVAQASREATPSEFRGRAGAGDVVRWDPVLAHASVIRGIARSAHGGVAKTWLVKAVREGLPEAPILSAWTGTRASASRGQDLRQCWTGEDGAFAVPCSPGGTYRLELRARAAWNGQVHGSLDGVAAGARDVDLRVQLERGFVRARFVDAAGRPAAGVLSAVRRASGAEHRSESKPDGSVERDLRPGTYVVVAWPEGGAPRTLGTRDVGADEVVDFGDVRVDASGTLTLRGAASARIVVRSPDGLGYHVARSGADLVAEALPPGEYIVSGRRADGRPVEARARVESGVATALALD